MAQLSELVVIDVGAFFDTHGVGIIGA
jgi:hypothetical protein